MTKNVDDDESEERGVGNRNITLVLRFTENGIAVRRLASKVVRIALSVSHNYFGD